MRLRIPITLIANAILPLSLFAGASHPVLVENCVKCHGGAKQKGGLDLRSLEAALKGGENGPALVAGKPEASALFKAVQADSDPHMPPEEQLSDGQITSLRDWIAGLREPAKTAAADIPHGIDPSLAIDLFIQKKWQAEGISPAQRCDDSAFVRRIYLDLIGRIPTRSERDAFLAATDSAKRATLVNRLLANPEHAAHMAEVFNVVFLGREDEKKRKRSERKNWLAYLNWVFETNRGWNKVAKDLLVARPSTKEEAGASWFLYEQRDDHQQIATRVSATLLGKQVQCAQCHDHPVSPEIEQRHYWGLVSFFNRSVNVSTPEGPRVAERASGGYAKFANLEGESSDTELVMLSGDVIAEPDGRRENDAKDYYAVAPPDQWLRKLKKDEKLKKDVSAVPVPKFSRREAFTKASTAGNRDFSRAIVNRVWALLFGRGIVHPVDQMDSAHPPSHPELLRWLAQDFSEHGYDVRRLIVALTKSQAYQLDSRPGSVEGLPPEDAFFARALDKPLSAEVLLRSLRVATGLEGEADEGMRAIFAKVFPDLFEENYSPSVQQAMFVTNGTMIDALLAEDAPLVQRLSSLPDSDSIAREAFVSILGREPDDEERTRSREFLTNTEIDTIRQFCWALMAGAEFRINH